ncbi:unnamed protein product [Closterium sp. NIES-54]
MVPLCPMSAARIVAASVGSDGDRGQGSGEGWEVIGSGDGRRGDMALLRPMSATRIMAASVGSAVGGRGGGSGGRVGSGGKV